MKGIQVTACGLLLAVYHSITYLTVCLTQVLQNLGKDKFLPQPFEQVGTRLAKVLEKV